MKLGMIGHAEDKFTPEGMKSAIDLMYEIISHRKVDVGISGRCPISICENCGKHSFSKATDPIVGYVECEFCGLKTKRRAGGIDIEFEKVCNKLNIPLDLKVPRQHQWNAEYGYKKRNNDIAKDSDELHIMVVDKYPLNYKGLVFSKCYHCGTTDHVKSGACWTGKLAQRLGKKVEWHIIKNFLSR